MNRTCTLMNPSEDIVQRLNQRVMLKQHGIIESEPAEGQTSLCVELDSLPNLLETLPSTFALNINVPETETPCVKSLSDVAELAAEYQVPDVVCTAMMEKYNIGHQTLAIVLDLDKYTWMAPDYIAQCINIVQKDTFTLTNVVIFTIGHRSQDKFSVWYADLKTRYPVNKVQNMDQDTLLRLLAQCGAHVLTGNLWGWWGAALSQSKHVVCPSPWLPDVSNSTRTITEWTYVTATWPYCRFFDQAYYINLDRRPDRREHMETQVRRFNLAVTRVPAVDGSKIEWKPEYGIQSKYWNTGAFAYCLSYREAIVDAISKGHENVLIMDDDAVLEDNMYEILSHAWKDLPDDWHMLYLGANHGHPIPSSMPTEKDRLGDYLYKMSGSMGSHAIILNKRCLKHVLNFVAAPYAPLDMYFSMYHKFFPCYITFPGLASQMAGHSDILGKKVNYSNDWQIDYINHIKGRVYQPPREDKN